MSHPDRVDYQTDPAQYQHWTLQFDGPVATLLADFDENAGLRPGYKLKLNSYDLGVDIELNDAINRIRFEHPEVRTVVITSLMDATCGGAVVLRGTPKDVERDVKEHMDVLKPDGRWIAGSSHSIVNYIPCENFAAMINAIHKYGTY